MQSTTIDHMPTASVIICNYNGHKYLPACLCAVMRQHLVGGFEVILVDNCSTDDSVEYVQHEWPTVTILRADRNLGFAAGNNLGIRHARGKYIVLLNNDTTVHEGWLAALVNTAESDSTVAAVTSKIVYMGRPDIIQNAGGLLLTDGSGADRGFGEHDKGQYDHQEEVFGACGCAVLYRREALADVGLFDESFFCYYEDMDLNWRLRLRGWRVVYQPAAMVEHLHAGTSVEWSPFFLFHAERNRIFMVVKNAPLRMVLTTLYRFARLLLTYVFVALQRRLRKGAGSGAIAPGLSRVRVYLDIAMSVTRHLPHLMVQRLRIRRTRRLPDREIQRWLFPKERWDERFAR
ncbi:MAG TPA: glycosyltransferase family 2 protein [Candidatus Dormibacteraeota bacterium]|nr:glycosyltransferase family 2 protein [Candidatus Dormibacteraeota bacterium]